MLFENMRHICTQKYLLSISYCSYVSASYIAVIDYFVKMYFFVSSIT